MPWRARDIRPPLLRRRFGRPQLKRDPLGRTVRYPVHKLAPVFSLALLSCASTLYTAQAGPNALDCALNFGINNGYTPAAGGTNGGFLRLERRDRTAYIKGGRAVDVLTITASQGELHIEATGFDYRGREMGAADRVKGEATTILQRCGTADSTKSSGAA